MARDIRWSPRASENLTEICEYIARDSEFYARKVAQEIVERIEEIPEFPKIGRIVPEYDDESIRERIYQNYRVVYRIKQEVIEIVTIHHSSKQLDL